MKVRCRVFAQNEAPRTSLIVPGLLKKVDQLFEGEWVDDTTDNLQRMLLALASSLPARVSWGPYQRAFTISIEVTE